MFTVTCPDCGSVREVIDWPRKGPIRRCRSCASQHSQHDPETRAKIAASVKAAWTNPETRYRQTEAIREFHALPEYRALLRERTLARPPMTEETREKLRAAGRRQKCSLRLRAYYARKGKPEQPVAPAPRQRIPLSKRDPAIAARWAALSFGSLDA